MAEQKRKKNARHFQLTLNQVERWDKLYSYLISLKSLNYLIACKEKSPATDHEHIHCYVQFTAPISLSLNKTEDAHIEICQGTPEQNVKYIKKNGNIIAKFGNLRRKGGPTIKEAMEMTEEELMELPLIYKNKVDDILKSRKNVIDADEYYKEVIVYYLYGQSGIGKSYTMIQIIKEEYRNKTIKSTNFNDLKYENGFWEGISTQIQVETAVYDDFRDSHMKPSEFINFIDYNRHNMNIKGGEIKNDYKLIIITSVQSPYDLYKAYTEKDKEPRKQWIRRIKYVREITQEPDDLKEKEIENQIKEMKIEDKDNEEDEKDEDKKSNESLVHGDYNYGYSY